MMGRGPIIAIITAGALALGSAASTAAPQSSSSGQVIVQGRVTSLAEEQRALMDANAQARRARIQSAQMEAKAKAATVEADRLNAQAAALAARIQASEADLRAGQARVTIIARLIADQSARLAQQQDPLVRLTAALQSFARRPPVLSLLQPGSLADTVHIRAAFSRIVPVIRQRTATLRSELDRSRRLRAMALQADEALRSSRVKLSQQRTQLQRLEVKKRIAAKGLSSGASLEAERATAMSERARDIDELMSRMEEAGAARERLAALPGPSLRPARPGANAALPITRQREARRSPPAYRLPVVGTIVTGMGELSDSGVRARGLTFATQPGAQLAAPAGGRIAYAGPYRGFGQIVIIDHGDGWTSLLAGMGRLSVAVGQSVDQSAPIGIARTGDHPVVTLELRRQGRPVDILALATGG